MGAASSVLQKKKKRKDKQNKKKKTKKISKKNYFFFAGYRNGPYEKNLRANIILTSTDKNKISLFPQTTNKPPLKNSLKNQKSKKFSFFHSSLSALCFFFELSFLSDLRSFLSFFSDRGVVAVAAAPAGAAPPLGGGR